MELLRLDSGDACKLSKGHKIKFMKHTDKASESSRKPVKSKEDQVRKVQKAANNKIGKQKQQSTIYFWSVFWKHHLSQHFRLKNVFCWVAFMCFIATIRIFTVFGLLAKCLLLLNLVPDIFGAWRGRRCNIWVSAASEQG